MTYKMSDIYEFLEYRIQTLILNLGQRMNTYSYIIIGMLAVVIILEIILLINQRKIKKIQKEIMRDELKKMLKELIEEK